MLRECGPTKQYYAQISTSSSWTLHVNLNGPQVEPDPSPRPPPLKDHHRRRLFHPNPSPANDDDTTTTRTSTQMAAPYEKEWQPPRPRNPWIIFRTDMLKQRQPRPPGTQPQLQADASKDIAKLWRNLSPEVREEYERRAAEEKVEHERRYPNYKYKPKSKAEKEREREEKKAEKLRKKEEAKRAKQLPPPTFAYGLQVPYYAAAAAMVPGPEDFPSPPISLASPLPDEPTPPSAGPSMTTQASLSSSSRNVSHSNSPASSRHTPDSDESVASRASAYLARKRATRVASGRESEPDLVPEELSWILSQIPGQPQQFAQSYVLGSGADGANVSPVANVGQQVVAPTVPQILTQLTYDHDWTLPTSDASQHEVFHSTGLSCTLIHIHYRFHRLEWRFRLLRTRGTKSH